MPRVHGIDLVPRRGRRRSSGPVGGGGCTRSNDSIRCGANNNDDISNADPSVPLGIATAASDQVNSASNNSLAAMDDKDNHHNGDNVADELGKVCSRTYQMTQEDANDKEDQSSQYSPPTRPRMNNQSLLSEDDNNSVSTPIVTESQATAITSNKTTTTILKNTHTHTTTNDNKIHSTNTNINNSVIKPQSKESIQHLEFSSHSFSVPSITKKSLSVSSNYQYDDDDDDFGRVGTALSFGIGPSLDTLKEAAENAERETTHEDKLLLPEEEEEEKEEEGEQQPTTTKTLLNPNAQWLYSKCSTAKSKMEYPHSTLHLATKILIAIRQHYSPNNHDSSADDDDDYDEQSQKMQSVLFKLIDEGKKRDLQFVFDVSSKSLELCEDYEGLTVDALRDVAVNYGDDDVEVDYTSGDDIIMKGTDTPQKAVAGLSSSLENKGGDSTPATATESSSTSTPQKGREGGNMTISSTRTPASSMRKTIRSRRKKRQSGEGKRNNNDTPNTKEGTSGNIINTNTTNNDSKARVDFHIQNDDDLNMQEDDDDKWSFLSSAQNKATESNVDKNNDDEEEENKEEGLKSPIKMTCNTQQSLDFTAEEDGTDVAIQEDVESSEHELAVSAKNETEDSVDDDDDTKDDEQDYLVQTGTLSFDHQNEAHNIDSNKNVDDVDEETLPQNEIPPLELSDDAPVNESDDESRFSQGESDLIDEVKLSSRKRSERREVVRIMFTGVTPTRRHMQMIETIGAEIVESIEKAHTATHVIVTDGRAKLRRTPKLMICICKTSNILSTEWLEQSANEQKALDATPFLWVGDKEAESKYSFSMKDTVQNGILAREHRGGVFGGYYFYVCSGIAGNRAPSIKEFKLIIEAAGGHLLNSLAPSEVLDPLKTIIITSDPPTPSQLIERGVKNIAKCGGKLETTSWLFHSIITQTNSLYEDDDTVGSVSTPGSRVSHVEVASPSPQKPPGPLIPTSVACNQFPTRDGFLSNNEEMSWMETLESSQDESFVMARGLWQNYFNEGVKSFKTSRKTPSKPARRLRGRMHSLSPMVGVTAASTDEKNAPKKESILNENSYITWEAIVLFTLQIRARELEARKSMKTPEKFVPASSFFSSPIAIQGKGKALALLVNANATDSADTNGSEIFGTLQDVFSLHQKRSSGMIPEQVVAAFAIMAIDAVSAMHECGVVHNNIGMDSFLVVKRNDASSTKRKKDDQRDEWFLQLIGFGDKAVVLTCHEHACRKSHYEHDYNCLANVIHQLVTGGVGITFNINQDGYVEFASKQFINGNLFLRGALSWCALMDALLGIGDVQQSDTSNQFRLAYPINPLQLVNEDDAPNKRLYQFGWSSRMLQELLLSTQNDSFSTFLEELCSLNSRFVLPNVSLDIFARSESSNNQTFEFATQLKIAKDNESLRRGFAQREAKLEADALALEDRESNHRGRDAKLKVDLQNCERLHKSILKKEREVQMKEDQLVQKYFEQEERLNRMNHDILLREQRLQEGIRQFEESKQHPHEHREEPVSQHSNARSSYNSSGLKRKNESLHQTPPPMNSSFQSLENNVSREVPSSQNKRRRSRTNSNLLEQLTPPPHSKSNTTNENETNYEEYPQQELNNSELYAGMKQQEEHESSQESRFSFQEGSSQKRKRGNRGKSPVASQLDSLQSLPRSPKKQPKKVFIAFEE